MIPRFKYQGKARLSIYIMCWKCPKKIIFTAGHQTDKVFIISECNEQCEIYCPWVQVSGWGLVDHMLKMQYILENVALGH